MNYFLLERKDNNYSQSKTAIEIGNYQLFTIFFWEKKTALEP